MTLVSYRLRVWPLALGVALCWLVWAARESLRYGWIPGKLFWIGAVVGLVHLIAHRIRCRVARDVAGYFAVLFGAVVCVALTHLLRQTLYDSEQGFHLAERFHWVASAVIVLTPCVAPATFAAIEVRHDRSLVLVRLAVGITVAVISGIAYAPGSAGRFFEELGIPLGSLLLPASTGLGGGGRLGVADIQLFATIAATSGSYSICVLHQREHVETSVVRQGNDAAKLGRNRVSDGA